MLITTILQLSTMFYNKLPPLFLNSKKLKGVCDGSVKL